MLLIAGISQAGEVLGGGDSSGGGDSGTPSVSSSGGGGGSSRSISIDCLKPFRMERRASLPSSKSSGHYCGRIQSQAKNTNGLQYSCITRKQYNSQPKSASGDHNGCHQQHPLEMRRMLDLYLEVKEPGSNKYERINSCRRRFRPTSMMRIPIQPAESGGCCPPFPTSRVWVW